MGSHGRRGDAFGVNKSNTARRCSSAEGAAWCLLEEFFSGSTPIRRSPESGPSSLLGFPPTRTAHPTPAPRELYTLRIIGH